MADGNIPALAGDPPGISEAALKKAEEFIEADEGVQNRLSGTAGNVATTIANTFNSTGSLPGAFATLTAAGLTQVSGETAVGTQQATFDAMNQFMGVMLDPHADGCGASANDAYAPMARKAPAGCSGRAAAKVCVNSRSASWIAEPRSAADSGMSTGSSGASRKMYLA